MYMTHLLFFHCHVYVPEFIKCIFFNKGTNGINIQTCDKETWYIKPLEMKDVVDAVSLIFKV